MGEEVSGWWVKSMLSGLVGRVIVETGPPNWNCEDTEGR